MIRAHFIGDKVVSGAEEAFMLYEKSRFGEKKNGKVEYGDEEVLFLVSSNRMKVFSANKEISEESLFKKAKKRDKRISAKIAVYSDLRKKGYVVKSALKFGAEFRVYDKGVRPGEEHARWIVFSVKENEQINWHEFAAKSRVAHSTKKSLLLGVVDAEGDVTYYEVNWVRL